MPKTTINDLKLIIDKLEKDIKSLKKSNENLKSTNEELKQMFETYITTNDEFKNSTLEKTNTFEYSINVIAEKTLQNVNELKVINQKIDNIEKTKEDKSDNANHSTLKNLISDINDIVNKSEVNQD